MIAKIFLVILHFRKYINTLILTLLVLSSGNIYAQFGFFINYQGKVNVVTFDGAPYQMAIYQEDDPMARIKITHQKGTEEIGAITDSITDENRFQLESFDFCAEIRTNPHIFKYDYPFYESNYSGIHEITDTVKGYFEYQKTNSSLPTFGGQNDGSFDWISTNYFSSYNSWVLDKNYRIAAIKQIKSTAADTGNVFDTLLFYNYYYNKKGKIDSVAANTNSSDFPSKLLYTYYLYNTDGTLNYLVSTTKQVPHISSRWCNKQFDAIMRSQDTFNLKNTIDEDNTPNIIYFGAWRYTNKKLSTVYQYDLNFYTTKDSITYNIEGLPVCIDNELLDSYPKVLYNERWMFYFDENKRVEKSIYLKVDNYDSIKSKDIINFNQSMVPTNIQSTYSEQKYTYDEKGRINHIEISGDNKHDAFDYYYKLSGKKKKTVQPKPVQEND